MVRFTGDFSPRASGSASLGVEMRDGVNGFTTDIRPYAHVHMNSGVFHDTLQGQSGVLRFNHEQAVFEVSVDGGNTFNFISVGPHSGGGGAGTLQEAYDGDNNIFTSIAQGGPVNIQGVGVAPLSLATDGFPHIQMSGLIALPTDINQRGDFWIQAHTAAWEAQLGGNAAPSTQAEANAQSLGPALPFYNTGSGVTNVMIASGIGSFTNVEAVSFDQDNDAVLDRLVDIAAAFPNDRFYSRVSGSGVVFNVGGLYRIDYTGTAEKTDGNYLQHVTVGVRVRDLHGNEFMFSRGQSCSQIRDSDVSSKATSAGSVYGDFEANEATYLRFSVGDTPLPDFDKVRVPSLESTIDIQYIGPKRVGKFNRIKI